MSTLIELKDPYKSKWRKGYLQSHPNGRKYVCLFNSRRDRSLVSYARYLKSVQLGYFLSDDVEVDHEDDDFRNDSLGNLQLLSVTDNLRKEHIARRGEILLDKDQFCEICNVAFKHYRHKRTCSSEDCRKKLMFKIGSWAPLTEQHKLEISARVRSGQTYDSISLDMRISTASINKYKDYGQ